MSYARSNIPTWNGESLFLHSRKVEEYLVHALTTAVTDRIERGSSQLFNTKRLAGFTNHLRFKICTLISVKVFWDANISGKSQECFSSGPSR
ncbi:hypothetical protein ElyMa_000171100 [Elysia marginata]|uniref:Uncharacterized protein n=1 Tax=Elysia marginata TaxID=1093978 RepID=A0AAV4ETY0_9GAST|nr:hypothetical protein ElyMa_000171100 [Elysia marginata]